jgi:hypothetical protein
MQYISSPCILHVQLYFLLYLSFWPQLMKSAYYEAPFALSFNLLVYHSSYLYCPAERKSLINHNEQYIPFYYSIRVLLWKNTVHITFQIRILFQKFCPDPFLNRRLQLLYSWDTLLFFKPTRKPRSWLTNNPLSQKIYENFLHIRNESWINENMFQ